MRGVHRRAYRDIEKYPARPGFTYLYAMTESDQPLTPRNVKYIGMTIQRPLSRLYHHLQDRHRGEVHRDRWIRKLVDSGGEPRMHILALVPNEYAAKAEIKLIEAFRKAGAPLTNISDGGEGSPGHYVSKETREKISRAHKGVKERIPTRPDVRERFIERLQRRWADPDNRKLHSEKMKTWHRQADHSDRLARISEALKGKTVSHETREKISMALSGKRLTSLTRKKMSSSQWRRFRINKEMAGQLNLFADRCA